MPKHHQYPGVEIEVYIPAAAYRHPAAKRFVVFLQGLEPGATISQAAHGVWKGAKEETFVYRLILHKRKFNRIKVRAALREAVVELMTGLAGAKKTRQDAIMFTERDVAVHMTRL